MLSGISPYTRLLKNPLPLGMGSVKKGKTMEKFHCIENRTGKNVLVVDKKNIIFELRDETNDIRAWIRSQKSYSSYIHQKAYITHEGKDRRPCLLHVVRDYDYF